VEPNNQSVQPFSSQQSPTYSPITLELVPRHLKMHYVNETELDAISSVANSMNMTFFGICSGAFISFGSVVWSGSLPDPNRYALFNMLTYGNGLLSVYFLIQGIREYLANNKRVKDIKQGRVVEISAKPPL